MHKCDKNTMYLVRYKANKRHALVGYILDHCLFEYDVIPFLVELDIIPVTQMLAAVSSAREETYTKWRRSNRLDSIHGHDR